MIREGEHHDNRYEDGDTSTGIAALDYTGWIDSASSSCEDVAVPRPSTAPIFSRPINRKEAAEDASRRHRYTSEEGLTPSGFSPRRGTTPTLAGLGARHRQDSVGRTSR